MVLLLQLLFVDKESNTMDNFKYSWNPLEDTQEPAAPTVERKGIFQAPTTGEKLQQAEGWRKQFKDMLTSYWGSEQDMYNSVKVPEIEGIDELVASVYEEWAGDGGMEYFDTVDDATAEQSRDQQAKRIRDSADATFENPPKKTGLMAKPDSGHSGAFESKDDFLKAIIPEAKKAAEKTGLDWRMIVAQSAIETGWGKKVKGNSFFGIKGHGSKNTITFATQEEIGGKRVTINDSFRAYDNLGDSVEGYADFLLNNPRYTDYLEAGSLEEASKALQKSGYATDSSYGRKVLETAKGKTLLNFLQNNPEFE